MDNNKNDGCEQQVTERRQTDDQGASGTHRFIGLNKGKIGRKNDGRKTENEQVQ